MRPLLAHCHLGVGQFYLETGRWEQARVELCAALDLYRAMGGGERWRLQWMRLVTFHFTVDVLRQTARNLWHDKALLRWSTWRSGFEFLFGAHGVVRCTYKPWRAYFRADFHPSRHDAAKAFEWLRRHESDYTVVRR